MDHPDLAPLRARLAEITDLHATLALLDWDQNVHMPIGGAAARGRQLATLARIAHERVLDPELGRALARAERMTVDLDPDDPAAALVRVARRDLERAVRVPASFHADLAAHGAAAFQAWSQARGARDFATVAPHLERGLELSHQYAAYFPEAAHPADALIDLEDEGMTVASLRPLFAELRAGLLPLVEAAAAATTPMRLPEGPFAAADQLEAALELAAAIGYDLERGRQDVAPHPFASRFAHGDVRITTRVKPNDLTEALFSTLHEAGHALYEQGVAHAFDGTPLARGVSAGIHESQSRLWENQVGRSRAFWTYALPRLRRRFPVLEGVEIDDAYRSVNRVARSLIRTDADELTYTLHVLVRFDLELDLLEGRLAIGDLPGAWNDRYEQDLGVRPEHDAEGVLQDVHWFAGPVGGAFQGYALGNVLSAQFHAAADRDLGGLDGAIEAGEFAGLHGWLQEHVYRHGRARSADRLVRDATGGPIDPAPYLTYLRSKFGDLYPDVASASVTLAS
jgi:carboxypeptidase Taq